MQEITDISEINSLEKRRFTIFKSKHPGAKLYMKPYMNMGFSLIAKALNVEKDITDYNDTDRM